ncbi:hypothetical protein Lfu02_69190 [Longispora fulva]|uniref:Biotin carboxylase n=1 Tax=Longispora fulva TaxID=619741 RepID=A0A8J7GGZ8_9ACTN|nr:ATP-grasp domain-containing protein [Longispora fulva]MBG6134174.1 biotin carboxylase [Longispora fulva]GIG62547.1 hypothetical protein Lfu02_69190 [Longispora fulva]
MRVLVLNRFLLRFIPYSGYDTGDNELVLITSASGISPDPAQREKDLAGYARVVIVDNPLNSAEFEYQANLLHAEFGFGAVVALAEADLLTAARLRTRWGIAGQNWDATVPYRDKLEMKRVLSAAGIPVAPFARVDNVTDLLGFVDQVGYPVVVKPRRSSSSLGVRVLRDTADLAAFVGVDTPLRGDVPPDYLAERYIPNEMYNVDGIVTGGEVTLCWPSATTSCLGFADDEILLAAGLEPGEDWQADLVDLVRRTMAVLPTETETLFHAEVFRTPDGRLVLNEIGCRMGGGRIWEQFLISFDIDIIAAHLRRLLGSKDPAPVTRTEPAPQTGWALMPPRPGTVAAVPTDCPVPGIRHFDTGLKVGAELGRPQSSVDAIASFVAAGATRAEVQAALTAAAEWFYAELKLEEPLA